MIDYIGSADNIGHHHFRFQLIQNGIGADPMAVFCEISAIKGKPIKRKQMLKFHLVCFPVLCWRGSFCIAESLGEVAGRRKAQNSCDLRERKVRLGQETLSFFYAAVDDIIDGRNTVFALKGVYHIIFGDADLFCQLVQRDIFLIMVVNVALYRCTLPLLKGVIRTCVTFWSINATTFFLWTKMFSPINTETATIVPVVYLYDTVFGGKGVVERDAGAGAAVGVVLTLIIIAVYVITNLILKDSDLEY